jgi:hypothetical protein
MSFDDINKLETDIDLAFADNDLKEVSWAQSVWTMLSAAEDHHFNIAVINPLPENEIAIYVDGLINSLTHPMRVLYKEAPRQSNSLERRYIEAHYKLAVKWIDSAEDYNHFCSIFPLYHANEIELTINDDWLEPSGWSDTNLSYEVYDRLVAKRDPNNELTLDATPVLTIIRSCLRSSGGSYSLNFTRRLVAELQRHFGPIFESRHVLPDQWQFSLFSLSQYRAIFTFLQIAAEAWFVARQIVASDGVIGAAYEGAVWTPRRGALVHLLKLHTGVKEDVIENVLRYLTFGEVGIRNPDIAIQPIVDLGNDHYAISPFIMTQINAERNLCVLLNQIQDDRKLYASLVDEKENHLRIDTIQSLSFLGFDFMYGKLQQTDVDLAVVDHSSKTCLCIELKWFIEPAEIREVLMRSEELAKGVIQAKILNKLFADKDARLLALLGIDTSYEFFAMVGSVNFIGRPTIQDSDVPITKLWHVVSKIQELRDLRTTIDWLKRRDYLPIIDQDYKVNEVPIQCGKWRSRWYGITYA